VEVNLIAQLRPLALSERSIASTTIYARKQIPVIADRIKTGALAGVTANGVSMSPHAAAGRHGLIHLSRTPKADTIDRACQGEDLKGMLDRKSNRCDGSNPKFNSVTNLAVAEEKTIRSFLIVNPETTHLNRPLVASPVRVRILRLLRVPAPPRTATVNQISERSGWPAMRRSRHNIHILEESDLIDT